MRFRRPVAIITGTSADRAANGNREGLADFADQLVQKW
jgi:hypothetical protein